MRRWTAAAVLLVCLCLASPAVATCPGCCAPAGDQAGFACAVAMGCGECDPLVRPALLSERASDLHLSIEAPAALPPRVLDLSASSLALTGTRQVAFVPGRSAPSASLPLRL